MLSIIMKYEVSNLDTSAAATLLALSNVSGNPIAQSFLILSGIFSAFGFVYAIFLAYNIGDRKTELSDGFCVCYLTILIHLLT
jgi:hypothetical protein